MIKVYSQNAQLKSGTKHQRLVPQNPTFTFTLQKRFGFIIWLKCVFLFLFLFMPSGSNILKGKEIGSSLETLPLANPDFLSVCGPTTITIDVLANDLAAEFPIQKVYQVFQTPGNVGTLSVAPDSLSVIYTMPVAFTGTDVFSYQIQDQSGLVSEPANIEITGSCGSTGFIAGVAFIDNNGNGIQNTGENGLAGVAVSLYNAETGSFIVYQLTDAEGNYYFGDLADGLYIVQVPEWGGVEGFSLSTPSFYTVSILGGSNFAFADFGYVPQSGTLVANDDCAETPVATPVTINVLNNDLPASGLITIVSATVLSGGTSANVTVNSNQTITYTPPMGFNGTALISYTITQSGSSGTDNAIVTVFVGSGSSGNNPPVLPDIYLCSNPIQPIIICLSSTDADGDPIHITQVNSLYDCGITVLNDTCLQYIALPGFFGVDYLSITVCDQHIGGCSGTTSSSLCATVNAIITVPCPNAVNDIVTTPINTAISVNVLANDTGVPPLAVSVIGQPYNGNAAAVGNNVLYTPNTGFVGIDTVQYQITDPNGNTDVALVIIYVIPNGELPPNANDDFYPCPFSVASNGTLSPVLVELNVLNNDTDPNLNLTGIVAIGTPLYGTATIVSGGGSILYVPSSAFLLGNITEQFYYVVSDAAGLTDTAWVSFTCNLTPDNACVVAANDALTIPSGTSALVNVLSNDTYCASCSPVPAGCVPLPVAPQITTITIPAPPSNGTVTINNNGDEDTGITYIPNPGFNGTDIFTYTVCTNDGNCATATVTITVLPPSSGQQIIANNDFATTPSGTSIVLNILNNDVLCLPPLPCLPPLSTGQLLGITILAPPTNGNVIVNSFGGSSTSVTYSPNSGFTGTDVFQYIVCSLAQSLCDTATVTITVTGTGTNNPPVAEDDYNLVTINTPITLQVLQNDFDPDGDDITITAITDAPNNGTAVIVSGGTAIVYTPNTGFVGNDTLQYQITDGELTDVAWVIIYIEGTTTNDNPPVAVDDYVSTPMNTPVNIAVLANDYDLDGDVLTVTAIILPPQNGTANINLDGTVTYTPNTGFAGVDTFSYIITDGELTDVALVIIFVEGTPPNLPPVAVDDFVQTPVNTPVTIPVLDNDTDPNGDPVSIVAISDQPNNGFVFINFDGTITYNPDPGFIGVDTFAYQITDGELTDIGLVIITVVEDIQNLPPVAVDDVAQTPINLPVTIPVLGNDTDPNGDVLTVVEISDPANGTAILNPDGTVTYTPDTDFIGTDTFTYIITDGEFFDTATVVITILPDTINLPPVAVDDVAQTPVNLPVTIPVLGNDTDPNGDVLTVVEISDPANGTAILNPDGTVTYVPDTDFVGTDTFTYIITDGEFFDTATVVITILPDTINLPPVAVDDVAETLVNTSVIIPVLGNDTDPNGDVLTVVEISDPANGTAILNPDGTVTYVPDTDFIGTDTFTYIITDGEFFDTATVVITILPDTINLPPVAVDDVASTPVNLPVTIPVLDNDTDPNGDVLTVVEISDPANGTAILNPDGTVTYVPDTDFIGTDTFTYIITDGEFFDTATVVITILPDTINLPPVAVDDVAQTPVNLPVTIPVLGNDTDPNADVLTVVEISDPANGTAILNPDGTVTYVPDTDFIGTDTFTYIITDGEFFDTATVVITILPDTINLPPVAVDDVAQTPVNLPVTIPVLGNDTDPNGDVLTVVEISDPANGTAILNPDGTVTYVPDTDFVGTDTFTYIITDGEFFDTATVVITILPDTINLPPVAVDDVAETLVNTSVIIPVLDNDTDPNGDVLTVVEISDPANGTANLNFDGTISYLPDTDFIGTDTFTYIITDGEFFDTATVIITILPDTVNLPPLAVDDTAQTPVNTSVTIPVLDNDTDPNGDTLTVVEITDPSNGTVILNPDGTVTYIPNTNFEGIDTFTYIISDGILTDTALVIVTVGDPNNEPPIAIDDAISTPFETPVEIAVLDNDSDPNGDTLTVVSISTLPLNGTAVINPDGTITYTPNTGFIGVDVFSYVISDSTQTDTAVVTVTILAPDCNVADLFIPNGFSPNGDGINDIFVIENLSICFPDNEIVIFNRWGDEVFRQKDYSTATAWNGEYQNSGKRVPDGTYFYVLLLDEEGNQKRNGFIEVLR